VLAGADDSANTKQEMSEEPSGTIVVTGTSRGIGHDIAIQYLSSGWRVFGCSRGEGTIENEGYAHESVDVSSAEQVKNWARSLKKTAGQIDVMVCNAGLAPAASLLTLTPPSVLDGILQTNVGGTFHVCCEFGKIMMRQRHGSIITTSSMAVGLHEEGTSAYSASKSAIVEMTKILAKELAPFGVNCNVIAPSMYETEALQALGDNIIERAKEKLTVKRSLSIEEICSVISFFGSPANRVVTGQVIYLGLVA